MQDNVVPSVQFLLNVPLDVSGVVQVEVAAVHNDLAEQAYRSQAQDVLRGTGQLTDERKQYLDQMRQQLGLQQGAADKIIKEVRGGF
jgi:hypothetical protein